ncbi:MAG TPA: N-acetylmuramoyl-L-alanine amidase [Flavitalea sp.]|nr:N-acetylmuramoyl-L-alanine amidase [Flavitalea sp.]
MRTINHIILHCTATPQSTTIPSIQRYWREELHWKNPGYHFIIKITGEAVNLLPIEQVSNGVAGHNHDSINISYIGGIAPTGNPLDNRTTQQVNTQIELVTKFKKMFPNADVVGHRDFLTPGKPGWKYCPSFDVRSWWEKVKSFNQNKIG